MNDENSSPCGCTDRRGFLLLAAAAAVATGCETVKTGGGVPKVVDAGLVSAYQAEGVYSQYRYLGFFVVRRGGQLMALSSLCTHRQCKLEAEADKTFYCPCHGSTFDPAGHVKEGPATVNLPVFATATDARGHLLVTVTVAS